MRKKLNISKEQNIWGVEESYYHPLSTYPIYLTFFLYLSYPIYLSYFLYLSYLPILITIPLSKFEYVCYSTLIKSTQIIFLRPQKNIL